MRRRLLALLPSSVRPPAASAPMAPFRDRLDDFQRLDWRILQHGAIALYHERAVLEEDRAMLVALRYRVHLLDAGTWRSAAELHEDVRRTLSFPDPYGRNLAALVDCLAEMPVPEDGGTALVIRRFDAFARAEPALATALLEAIESTSRHHLLFGRRFVALVQSDDPAVRFAPVGARPVVWNPREMSATNRGLGTAG